jgi:sulfonate transport system substrate-binding protein
VRLAPFHSHLKMSSAGGVPGGEAKNIHERSLMAKRRNNGRIALRTGSFGKGRYSQWSALVRSLGFGLRLTLTALFVALVGCHKSQTSSVLQLRLGYFPNVTHAQALVGLAKGEFQKEFSLPVDFVPRVFNSGPSAIEALLADAIDLTYVGPSPAINGFVRSQGKALRVISGAASGGAVFVKRAGVSLGRKEDYAGKRFAAPQIGNSQDISLRSYLNDLGYLPKEKGGNVEVLPLANPDILMLFLRKEIDGAWVPEPWGAILVQRGNGSVLIDERDLWPDRKFATAVLVASKRILDERPDWVRRFLKLHVKLTRWVQENPEEAKQLINREITRLTRKPMPEKILEEAFSRFEVTSDPIPSSLVTFFQRARRLNYIRRGDIEGLCDLRYLDEITLNKENSD